MDADKQLNQSSEPTSTIQVISTVGRKVGQAGGYVARGIASGVLNIGYYITGGTIGGVAATAMVTALPLVYPPTAITYIPYLIARPVAFYYGFRYGGHYLAPACNEAGSFIANVTINGIMYTGQTIVQLANGGYQLLVPKGSPLEETLKQEDVQIQFHLNDEQTYKNICKALQHVHHNPKENPESGTELQEIPPTDLNDSHTNGPKPKPF